jgi:hypothetical protein
VRKEAEEIAVHRVQIRAMLFRVVQPLSVGSA